MTRPPNPAMDALVEMAAEGSPEVAALEALAIISGQLNQLIEAEKVKAGEEALKVDRDRDLHITLAEIHQRLVELRNQ